MTPLRGAVGASIAVMAALGLHAVATAPVQPPAAPQRLVVDLCTDPGRWWCGDDTFATTRYVPDGHYRDDGSIPVVGTQTAW